MCTFFPFYSDVKLGSKTYTALLYRDIDTGKVKSRDINKPQIFQLQEYRTRNGNKRLRMLRVSPVFKADIYNNVQAALREKHNVCNR